MATPKSKATLSLGGVLLAVLVAIFFPRGDGAQHAQPAGPASASANGSGRAADAAGARAKTSAPNPTTAPTGASTDAPTNAKPPGARPDPLPPRASAVGFTSAAAWRSHFDKHGREFGDIDADEYLARAVALRDAPLSATVLELVRDDGVVTRFDKASGAFVAFHRDRTIRTFFRPADGEAYFRRQAQR